VQYVLSPGEIGDLLVRVCRPHPAAVAAPPRVMRPAKRPASGS